MSPCLRVRAGAQHFLLPSASVGHIGLPLPPAGERSRVLDARRLDPDRAAAGRAPPIALEWRRPAFLVLVDAVDGIVEPEPRDLTDLPRALIGLGWFFDAA
ncbi:hypothetical protein [uncultured Aureimonas sp.]|uniref:hypothetical protein n=1 Tax=uncultured Aureimonas sp. TaxID=1604662 RepID=UPI0025FE6CF6|nr:hypothetical protein [uncultured Aureimonas sp.]